MQPPGRCTWADVEPLGRVRLLKGGATGVREKVTGSANLEEGTVPSWWKLNFYKWGLKGDKSQPRKEEPLKTYVMKTKGVQAQEVHP